MDKNPKGLRKGTWTLEEDTLLKKCIEQYGEGKWHLVPQKAGLNRCRKSCRLRWMNYLKPDIRRGQFTEDEIDLIIRLHKLLGNRWTLIAGRIPGRTANDIKNFWNTHIGKKMNINMIHENKSDNKGFNNCDNSVVKPRPLNLSKLSHVTTDLIDEENFKKETKRRILQECDEERVRYWSRLLETSDDHMSSQHLEGQLDASNIVRSISNDHRQNTFRQQDDTLRLGFDSVDMVWEFLNIEDL